MWRIIEAVDSLPLCHFETLDFIMGHLHRVYQNREVNKMTHTNLGVVFGPTAMRPKVEDPMKMASESGLCNKVLSTMVEEYPTIFSLEDAEGGDTVAPLPSSGEPLTQKPSLRRIRSIMAELEDSTV